MICDMPFRQVADVVRDVRYGMRQLRRSPTFTVAAVATLTLTIGASTALFSVLDAALLKQLPVSDAQQLVSIIVTTRTGGSMTNVPARLFTELSRAPQAFSGVFAFWNERTRVQWGSVTARATVQSVSGDYYSTLRVRAYRGRVIDARDEPENAPQVAVLGYQFWSQKLAADPDIIGKTLLVGGTRCTIVGVTPREFFGVDRAISPDVTVAMRDPLEFGSVWVMARRKPGLSLAAAQAETELAWARVADAQERASERATVVDGERAGGGVELRAQVPRLRLLAWLSAVVLLIGCANIANLLLARSMTRALEIGTRLAIGASRGRVIRQLLIESGLLAVFGGSFGLVFGYWAHRVLIAYLFGDTIPTGLAFALDWRLLSFTFAVSAVPALLFGLAPAVRVTRLGIQHVARAGQYSDRGTPTVAAQGLVLAQVAACVVLLVAGSLLVRTLANLRTVERGFSDDNVVLVNIDIDTDQFTDARLAALLQSLVLRAEAVPGVESVSLAANALFGSGGWNKTIWQTQESGHGRLAKFNIVGPRFFETTGMQLVQGRDFSPLDRLRTPPVVVVNEAFARRFCPDEPLGCRFGTGRDSPNRYEVIGVAKNAKYGTLRERAAPMIYEPLLQQTTVSSVTLHARTREAATSVGARVREALLARDHTLPVYGVRTIAQEIDDSLRRDRMVASMSAFFSVLALLLTCVGLFGVVAYSVERRRREIGIRIALGANPRQIVRSVVSGTLALVGIGAVVGGLLALLSTRALASLLFGLSPTDPATFAAALLIVLGTAGLAGYLPARAAASLDPRITLQQE